MKFKKLPVTSHQLPEKFKESFKKILFFLFFVFLFLNIWSKALVWENGGLYSSCRNCFGDWSAHITYITSFVYGENFPPQLPILSGHRFSYPFLADFLSALFIKLGLSLTASIIFPGFILSLSLVLLLYAFGKNLTRKINVGILTAFLFLFNGGLGFWWFLKDIRKTGIVEILKNLPREYTHLDNIEWINIITSQLLPQRGLLLGLLLSVFIYLSLWRTFDKNPKKHLLLAGFIASFLPLIHFHCFAAACFVAGWLAIYQLISKKGKLKVFKDWLWFFLPILSFGLPQVSYFYAEVFQNQSFLRWQPGWMAEGNVLLFWFKNLGLVLPLAFLGFLKGRKKLKIFSLPFWALFFLANLFVFQPWEWDNMKIFIHWYIVASVLAVIAIVYLLENRKIFYKILGILLFGLSILSGALDVARLMQYKNHKFLFWGDQQFKLAKWIRQNTNPASVFLTAGSHNHFLPALTGRKIVLGYEGWLWTYGLEYNQRKKDIAQIFKTADKTLLGKYNIDYIFIGSDEKRQGANEKSFEENFETILDEGGNKIYKVTQ